MRSQPLSFAAATIALYGWLPFVSTHRVHGALRGPLRESRFKFG
jgi:hypothetical protein